MIDAEALRDFLPVVDKLVAFFHETCHPDVAGEVEELIIVRIVFIMHDIDDSRGRDPLAGRRDSGESFRGGRDRGGSVSVGIYSGDGFIAAFPYNISLCHGRLRFCGNLLCVFKRHGNLLFFGKDVFLNCGGAFIQGYFAVPRFLQRRQVTIRGCIVFGRHNQRFRAVVFGDCGRFCPGIF